MARRNVFIEFHSFRALGYYTDLLGLKGAVQPTIPDGIADILPALGGNKDRWILWTSLPHSNRPGQPINPHDCEIDWLQPKTTPTNAAPAENFSEKIKASRFCPEIASRIALNPNDPSAS